MPFPQFKPAGHNPRHKDHRVLGHEPLLPQFHARRVRQGTRYRFGHELRKRSGHCVVQEEQEPPDRAYEPNEPTTAIDAGPLLWLPSIFTGKLLLLLVLLVFLFFFTLVFNRSRLWVRSFSLSASEKRHRSNNGERELVKKVEAFNLNALLWVTGIGAQRSSWSKP